jgi:MoxR-like ATPase
MSPELTTDETVRMLQKAAVLKHSELSLVKELLSMSDMVKFAKYLPGSEIHGTALNDAVKFVEITREPDLTAEAAADTKGGGNA